MNKKDSTHDDMILFGVDFGLKKIGIAIGQNVTKRASPLTICLLYTSPSPRDRG